MKIAQKVVIDWTFELSPDGDYFMILHFDTGDTEKFPVQENVVDANKLAM